MTTTITGEATVGSLYGCAVYRVLDHWKWSVFGPTGSESGTAESHDRAWDLVREAEARLRREESS